MEKKTRESNFELMRIISMFMIVLWHVIIHGRLLGSSTGLTNLIYNLLLCVFIVHVNSSQAVMMPRHLRSYPQNYFPDNRNSLHRQSSPHCPYTAPAADI